MPILKASRHDSYVKDAIVLDLGDLGRQAARLRSAAEAKAAQIITEAERQAAQMVAGAEARGLEQGRQEGLAQGLAEGREKGHAEALAEAKQQLATLQQAWSDVAGQLDGHRREMERDARQAVLAFALKLSEKVVHRVIEVDPTVVVDQVAGALAHVLRPLDVIVRVHPDDKPLLEKAMPELMGEFRHLEHIHLVEDHSVTRGGCIVTCGEGEVDATIETQLRRIIDLILPSSDGSATSAAMSEEDDLPIPEPYADGTPFAHEDPDGRFN